jgi:hypothetical protein
MKTFIKLAAAVAAALYLTACGGGEDDLCAEMTPTSCRHTVTPRAEFLGVWLDAAEAEDVTQVQALPYLYTIEPHGILVGATTPSEDVVRMWVYDWIETDAFTVRVQR